MCRKRIGPRARARTRNATTTKSSRARKQPAQWLSAGATTKRNDESSSQPKRLEIRMFCASTRELERHDPKDCGAVLAADAVNERAKEIFTLPTAAHFHCEKIPSIRFLIGKRCLRAHAGAANTLAPRPRGCASTPLRERPPQTRALRMRCSANTLLREKTLLRENTAPREHGSASTLAPQAR